MTIHVKGENDGSTDDSDWASPLQCVWKGPDYLTVDFVLAEYDDYKMSQNCSRLFTSILRISDADWSHTIEQIVCEKDFEDQDYIPDKDTISRMYRDLLSGVEESSDWDTIM